MHASFASPLKHLSLAGTATAVTVVALAGSAAATPDAVSPLPRVVNAGKGAFELLYPGHKPICYYHDLCVYRGGRFYAYFKCQTVTPSDSVTSTGWVFNNETPGTTAKFTGYAVGEGPKSLSLLPNTKTAVAVNWRVFTHFRTCP
jgi:hypothetical protein